MKVKFVCRYKLGPPKHSEALRDAEEEANLFVDAFQIRFSYFIRACYRIFVSSSVSACFPFNQAADTGSLTEPLLTATTWVVNTS